MNVPSITPVNRLEFPNPDLMVIYKESKDGKEKSATIKEVYNELGGKEVWFKLCTRDKYGKNVHEWRPCKMGIFAMMNITFDE